jgi:hydrophobe/amphiphile efflux-1 (HAE1) family protein
MISHFFIRRPIFATVISILITLAGLVAIFNLPVSQYPEIAPPQVVVTAVSPGADAQSLQLTVAAPIEEQINGVEDMLYMSSVSSSNGLMTLTVTFATGTNVDQAATNVANRVRLAEPRLPEEVRRNGVTVQKRSSNFLQILSVNSPDGRYDSVFLSNYTTINVLDAIKRVPGVGDAIIFGARDYSMRVWLRPDVMAHFGVTTSDVAAAIREQNAQFAVGKVGQEPTAGPVELTYTVTGENRLVDADAFQNIVVRANPDGSELKLRDVARIELGARDYDTGSRVNGLPTVNIGIFLQPGANALKTAKSVETTMEDLARRFPEGVQYAIPFDSTRFVEVSIEEVVKTLTEAAILVFIVVFLFLQTFRATLIPMLAVPVSLVGTFFGMYVLGFSINTLTLFGLVLAIGIVVDDAIVVLENVERIMRTQNKKPREAAFQAMTEVTGPVIAIVLVLVAVFLPVGFVGGLAGELYRQFAATIAVAVLLSGIVALTLTPALCALILREHEEDRHGKWLGAFNRWFERTTGRYGRGVEGLLRRPALAVGMFALLVVAIFGLVKVVPSGLVPNEDQGYFIGAALLPDGASLHRTIEVTERVEKLLLSDSAVERVVALPGFDFVGGGAKSNVATYFVILKHWNERKAASAKLDAVLGKFMGGASQIKEAVIFGFNPPSIQGLGSTGGFEFYVQNRGEGDVAHLAQVTNAFMAKANQTKGILGVRTLFRPDVPQLHVTLDRQKAKTLGVRVDDVFASLQSTFGTLYVNDFNRSGRTFRVQLQSEPEFRMTPKDLEKVYVRSQGGEMVPLSALLDVSFISGPEVIERFNGFPSVKLLGAAAPGFSSGQAIAAMEKLADQDLPADFGYAWSGTAYQEKVTGGSATQVFGFGLVAVFLILAAQYERWSLPIAVLLAVPFAVFGAFLAVWLRGQANDVFFQIGLVTLIGLAAKNAILIVEFAAQRHAEGMPLKEAAAEGARLRLRPIVMTSLAFVLGVLPLAISSGAGAASRHSIGTGVLGGMLGATFIAIFFIPVFYYLVGRASERKRLAAAAAGEDTAVVEAGR